MRKFNKPVKVNEHPEVWAKQITDDQIVFADLTKLVHGEKSGEKLSPFYNKGDFCRYVMLYVYKLRHYKKTATSLEFLMTLSDKDVFPDLDDPPEPKSFW